MSWAQQGQGQVDLRLRARRPRLRRDRRPQARHRLARPERRALRPGPGQRSALEQDDARPVRVPRPSSRRRLLAAASIPAPAIVPGRNGRSRGLPGQDRRPEGDHRDGAPVRRQGDPPERGGVRPRGQVPRADRRADEGARPVRGDDPRGVRRDGARPDDLRDDRRGALARLDLDLGRREHALHRLVPADEVRDGRAEGEVPAEDGDGRDPRCVLALRARGRLRRPGHQVDRQGGRRRLGDQRPEDVGHERTALRARVRPREDRPEGRPAVQGHDLLHLREGAGGGRGAGSHDPAADQEDGLQGRRVDRARLRRLQGLRRSHPRRPQTASARASAR